MSSLLLAIPLVDQSSAVDRPGHSALDAQESPSTAERLGLRRVRPTGGAKERKLEDWIASTIDHESSPSLSPATIWNRLIAGLPGARGRKHPLGARGEARTLPPVWARFQVAYKRGITIVRLVDKNLVKSTRLEELRNELLDLIAADNHRLIVDLSGVERFSSWVAAIMVEAAGRATQRPGGALKLRGVDERNQRVFSMAGRVRIGFAADQAAALASPWPAPPGPPALPVEILSALFSSAETAPSPRTPAASGRAPRREADAGRVVLLIQMGGGKARVVPVTKPRYLIGRQQGCDLRLSSSMISKQHAALIERDGSLYVQDLASTNGTMVRGTPLRNGETVVNHGDRIQFGPVVCTVQIDARGPHKAAPRFHDEDDHAFDSPGAAVDHGPTLTFPTSGLDAAIDSRIHYELIQDVLVVTPKLPNLEEDPDIDAIRGALHGLIEQALPRRVVVNLENVDQLAPRAIGVLLAHHLRLDDLGGSLRICQGRARIMTVLHQVRLTMLVECYPTLDQAVLDAWPCEPNRPRLDD